MNVGQAAHLSGQMSGQAAQMNQVGGSGVGGADGMPQHQPMQDVVGLGGIDAHFVMLRNSMREKIFEYIGRKQSSAEWRRRLPELARRLEEILFRKFSNKNEYFNMLKGPVEPQLQYAIKTLSAQNQQNQQTSRQIASSSGYGTMIPTPGMTQGSSGSPRLPYVTVSNALSSSGASMVSQNGNIGTSMQVNQNVCFLPDATPSNAMQDSLLRNGSSSGMVNGAPSSEQFIYTGKVVHGLPSGMDASTSLLAAHNSTVGQFNGHNGTTIKTESGYSSNSAFGFGNENVFLEQSVGDVSGGSFSSPELNGQPLNDPILDMDSSSFGFLSQIPRNFSFSDLSQDFSQSAEILENYGRSPFIPSETDNFPEPTAGEHTEVENRRLDPISEGVNFEDFGSD